MSPGWESSPGQPSNFSPQNRSGTLTFHDSSAAAVYEHVSENSPLRSTFMLAAPRKPASDILILRDHLSASPGVYRRQRFKYNLYVTMPKQTIATPWQSRETGGGLRSHAQDSCWSHPVPPLLCGRGSLTVRQTMRTVCRGPQESVLKELGIWGTLEGTTVALDWTAPSRKEV